MYKRQDVTTEKVNAENAKQMQEYEQGLEKVYEDYKETALRKSELALKLKEESGVCHRCRFFRTVKQRNT